MAQKRSTPKSESAPALQLGSFETEFERLGTIVEKLENGTTSLEETLKLYEQAITLAGGLTKLLTEAELRVEKLSKMHGEVLSEVEEDTSDEDDEAYDE